MKISGTVFIYKSKVLKLKLKKSYFIQLTLPMQISCDHTYLLGTQIKKMKIFKEFNSKKESFFQKMIFFFLSSEQSVQTDDFCLVLLVQAKQSQLIQYQSLFDIYDINFSFFFRLNKLLY